MFACRAGSYLYRFSLQERAQLAIVHRMMPEILSQLIVKYKNYLKSKSVKGAEAPFFVPVMRENPCCFPTLWADFGFVLSGQADILRRKNRKPFCMGKT